MSDYQIYEGTLSEIAGSIRSRNIEINTNYQLLCNNFANDISNIKPLYYPIKSSIINGLYNIEESTGAKKFVYFRKEVEKIPVSSRTDWLIATSPTGYNTYLQNVGDILYVASDDNVPIYFDKYSIINYIFNDYYMSKEANIESFYKYFNMSLCQCELNIANPLFLFKANDDTFASVTGLNVTGVYSSTYNLIKNNYDKINKLSNLKKINFGSMLDAAPDDGSVEFWCPNTVIDMSYAYRAGFNNGNAVGLIKESTIPFGARNCYYTFHNQKLMTKSSLPFMAFDIAETFVNCTSLAFIDGPEEGFVPLNMYRTYANCYALESFNTKNWFFCPYTGNKLANINTMDYSPLHIKNVFGYNCFENCESLKRIPNLKTYNNNVYEVPIGGSIFSCNFSNMYNLVSLPNIYCDLYFNYSGYACNIFDSSSIYINNCFNLISLGTYQNIKTLNVPFYQYFSLYLPQKLEEGFVIDSIYCKTNSMSLVNVYYDEIPETMKTPIINIKKFFYSESGIYYCQNGNAVTSQDLFNNFHLNLGISQGQILCTFNSFNKLHGDFIFYSKNALNFNGYVNITDREDFSNRLTLYITNGSNLLKGIINAENGYITNNFGTPLQLSTDGVNYFNIAQNIYICPLFDVPDCFKEV